MCLVWNANFCCLCSVWSNFSNLVCFSLDTEHWENQLYILTAFIFVPWCKYLSCLSSVLAEREAFNARKWFNKWKASFETYYILPDMESWYSLVSQRFIFPKGFGYSISHGDNQSSTLIVIILNTQAFYFLFLEIA